MEGESHLTGTYQGMQDVTDLLLVHKSVSKDGALPAYECGY